MSSALSSDGKIYLYNQVSSLIDGYDNNADIEDTYRYVLNLGDSLSESDSSIFSRICQKSYSIKDSQMNVLDYLDDSDDANYGTNIGVNTEVDIAPTISSSKDEPLQEYLNDIIPDILPPTGDSTYSNALSLKQDDKAYLQPILYPIGTNGLKYENGVLFFESLPEQAVTLRIFEDRKFVPADIDVEIDINFLNVIYGVIFERYYYLSKTCSTTSEFFDKLYRPVKISLEHLAEKLGIEKRESNYDKIRGTIWEYHRLMGIRNRGKRLETVKPVLLVYGFDMPNKDEPSDRNTISLISPYITSIIELKYREFSIKKLQKIKEGGLVRISILRNRSKVAVSVVILIANMIEQRGSINFDTSFKKILESDPFVLKKYESYDSNNKKNIFLKRLCNNVKELIKNETDIYERYPGFVFPDYYPTTSTIDNVFNFSIRSPR